MSKTTVYYRAASKKAAYGTWTELPPEKQNDRLILRNAVTGKILCPVHCRWEIYQAESDFCITCSGGKSSRGLIVSFVPEERKKQGLLNNGVIVLNAPAKVTERLSARWDRHEALNLHTNAPSDNDGVCYDYALFAVTSDTDECTCTLQARIIDRKKLLSINEGNFMLIHTPEVQQCYSFYFRGKRIRKRKDNAHSSSEMLIYSTLQEYEPAPLLPEKLNEYMLQTARELTAAYAGRAIRINTSCHSGLALIERLTHFLYEANAYDAIKALNIETAQFKHDDSDIYNSICAHIGIKSFPQLRKLFEKQPRVLLWYKRLYEMGFRDVNIIADILKLCQKTITSKSFAKYDYLQNSYWRTIPGVSLEEGSSTLVKSIENAYHLSDYAFFCCYSIPLRGERATWNAMNRTPSLSTYIRDDIAYQFKHYFTALQPKERELVVKQGFTLHVHDTLSNIVRNLEHTNIVFTYRPDQALLNDVIEGYQFVIPADSNEMHKLGAAMHNCVFSYWERVLAGERTIVYATYKGSYEICIEVTSEKKILQALASYNKPLTGEAKRIFDIWRQKHELVYR